MRWPTILPSAALRASLLAAAYLSVTNSAVASTIDAVFQINQASSNLAVTVRRSIFSDNDSKPLAGTIDATLDFGSSGVLPTSANITVTGADLSAVGTYNFSLAFGAVNITAAGLEATITTPSPPGVMTKPAGPGTTYQFDASQFTLTMQEGVITVTGLFNETVDLAEEDPPVAGASPPGTIGSLAIALGETVGLFTRFNATLNLPIDIQQTVTFGEPGSEQSVDLTLDATVVATASFYVPLSGVPADFNADSRVDDADFAVWKAGFGQATAASLATGDANGDGRADGADFLVWQQYFGTAPPTISAAPVPEPGAAAYLVALLALRRRRP